MLSFAPSNLSHACLARPSDRPAFSPGPSDGQRDDGAAPNPLPHDAGNGSPNMQHPGIPSCGGQIPPQGIFPNIVRCEPWWGCPAEWKVNKQPLQDALQRETAKPSTVGFLETQLDNERSDMPFFSSSFYSSSLSGDPVVPHARGLSI
jgi:hypothetical protein